MDVVKTKAALHAQTTVISWAITTIHAHNLFILNVIGDLATNAAEWTNGIYFSVNSLGTNMGFWHQRTGRASLYTLTTGNTGTQTHRVTEIKYDLAMSTAHCIADDIIHLLFSASSNATIALNTGVQVHCHCWMR